MPVTDVVARGVKASTTSNNSSKAIQHITSTVKSSAGNATSAVSKAPQPANRKEH